MVRKCNKVGEERGGRQAMLMDRGKGAEGEARTAAVATLNRRPNTGAPVRDPPPQVPLQRWTRFALPPDARPLVRVAYPSARLRSPKPISTPSRPLFRLSLPRPARSSTRAPLHARRPGHHPAPPASPSPAIKTAPTRTRTNSASGTPEFDLNYPDPATHKPTPPPPVHPAVTRVCRTLAHRNRAHHPCTGRPMSIH